MIIILGFGRSGTTWISDIVSKGMGGLVLFEPLHPQVCEGASEFCYYQGNSLELNQLLSDHLDRIMNGQIFHRWLLRNHLPSPMESCSDLYIENMRENCEVIGFKSIRANFLIEHFSTIYPDSKIIFVTRHPLAVLSSIKSRTRFWDEFGINNHLEMFSSTVESGNFLTLNELNVYKRLKSEISSNLLISALIWIYTHKILLKSRFQSEVKFINYEDFYFNPYKAYNDLFNYLDIGIKRVHPSYLFTPSMLTLKTRHALSEHIGRDMELYADRFWKNNLTTDEDRQIRYLFENAEMPIDLAWSNHGKII